MKRFQYELFICVLLFVAITAQSQRLELSFGPGSDIRFPTTPDVMYSNLTHIPEITSTGVHVFKLNCFIPIHSRMSVFLGASNIIRSLTYIQFHTRARTFFYNVMELPLGILYDIKIPNRSALYFTAGAGYNFALTSERKTVHGSIDNLSGTARTISMRSGDKPATFFQVSAGYRVPLNARFLLTGGFLFHLQRGELFRYKVRGALAPNQADGSYLSAGIRPSYYILNVGLGFLLTAVND